MLDGLRPVLWANGAKRHIRTKSGARSVSVGYQRDQTCCVQGWASWTQLEPPRSVARRASAQRSERTTIPPAGSQLRLLSVRANGCAVMLVLGFLASAALVEWSRVGADGTVQPSEPLCAIGDLHGDLEHGLRALSLCGAIDEAGNWAGGRMTVVQLGDVLDRGNASVATLEMLWSLRSQATAAGGEVVLLLGNHELLNMQGKSYYVAPDEMEAYGGIAAWRGAFRPVGGALGSRLLSEHAALAVRGQGGCRSLFVHAGLRLEQAQQHGSVHALDRAVRAQIAEGGGQLLDARNGPLWFRGYARQGRMGEAAACAELAATLHAVGEGAARMVAGHNIVPFAATRCEGMLHLIDVGMSRAYGGLPASWRCDVDAATGTPRIRVLTEAPEVPAADSERANTDGAAAEAVAHLLRRASSTAAAVVAAELPELCTACAATRTQLEPAAAARADPHGDCENYC